MSLEIVHVVIDQSLVAFKQVNVLFLGFFVNEKKKLI